MLCLLNRDTVSSIGVLRGSQLLPGTIDGMKHVCYFRHSLALDERRVKFLPEFAYGGSGIPKEDLTGKIPRIKEVWFAGTHSDMCELCFLVFLPLIDNSNP